MIEAWLQAKISMACAAAAMATSSVVIDGAAVRCSSISRVPRGPGSNAPSGITARERSTSPKTLVQEVASKKPGVRVFVVHSDDRLEYERTQRVKAMERVRTKLEKLKRRVAEGRLKEPQKIGAAAAAILTRNHGHRYYDWSLKDGAFSFF